MSGGAGQHRTARALAVARADRSLELARSDYAATRFGSCARRLTRAERGLSRHLARRIDLERIKRVNQWLGLCLLAGGARDPARQVFARAVSLPGPAPDPSVFPPPVIALWREAESGRGERRCRVRVPPAGGLLLDGNRVPAGAEVALGEHYLSTDDGRSIRARITEDCLLTALPPAESEPAVSLEPDEIDDAALLRRLGLEAGVRQIVLLRVSGDMLEVIRFDVANGRRLESSQRVVTGLLSVSSPGPVTAPVARITSRPPPAPVPPDRPRWYERWWVWTAVGLGVAAAISLPLLLQPETRYELAF